MIDRRTIGAFLIALTTLGVADACAQNHRRQRVKTHENDSKRKKADEKKAEEKSSEEASKDAAADAGADPSSPQGPPPPDAPAQADEPTGAQDDDAGDAGEAGEAGNADDAESTEDAAASSEPPPLYHWAIKGKPAGDITLTGAPMSHNVVLFYGFQLGDFPKIGTGGKVVNGGVPQAADLEGHLRQVRKDVAKMIPDPNWDGYAVINYEHWLSQLAWERRKPRYKARSMELAKKANPFLTGQSLKAAAAQSLKEAAERFTLETLRVCKEERPNTKWGFFVYNPHMKFEEEYTWLWPECDAFFPSIYLPYYSVDHREANRPWEQPSRVNRRIVDGRVGKMRKIAGDRPVLAVAQTQYHMANPKYGGQRLNRIDLQFAIEQPFEAGADGVIFWQQIDTAKEARVLENRLQRHFVAEMRRVQGERAAQVHDRLKATEGAGGR